MSLKITLAVAAALTLTVGLGWMAAARTPEKKPPAQSAPEQNSQEQAVQEQVVYVDEKLDALLSGADYKAGSLQERKELAQAVLSQLEAENYISKLFYQEEQAQFTFQYADGTLGGIALQDFSQGDGLPMN